ncbi:MAG TPA: hypothetical protein VK108_08170 [Pseudogracilibacillus sp.]|nr:hypothetical protein [Pseudogracilibacillus sp.]
MMKITVSPKPQKFALAMEDQWHIAVGHKIYVGNYIFCVTPHTEQIRISEVRSGAMLFSVPYSEKLLNQTANKESAMKLFYRIGGLIEEKIQRVSGFYKQVVYMSDLSKERLGEKPSECFEHVVISSVENYLYFGKE